MQAVVEKTAVNFTGSLFSHAANTASSRISQHKIYSFKAMQNIQEWRHGSKIILHTASQPNYQLMMLPILVYTQPDDSPESPQPPK